MKFFKMSSVIRNNNNLPFLPTLPSSQVNFTPYFSYVLPSKQHRGTRNGGCGQFKTNVLSLLLLPHALPLLQYCVPPIGYSPSYLLQLGPLMGSQVLPENLLLCGSHPFLGIHLPLRGIFHGLQNGNLLHYGSTKGAEGHLCTTTVFTMGYREISVPAWSTTYHLLLH